MVKFDSPTNANSAIEKFTSYQYGGRPLGLSYVSYGGDGGMQYKSEEGMDTSGMTQEGMM